MNRLFDVRSIRRVASAVVLTISALGLSSAISLPAVLPASAYTPAELPSHQWLQIRQAIEADSLKTIAVTSGFEAANAAQNYRARFTSQGFALAASDSDWTLPVRFLGHAWQDQALIPALPAAPVADGARVEFHRGDITEWYLNRSAGIEQGFTIAQAPAGEGRHLEVHLQVGGGFTARQDGPNADLIRGNTHIDYDKLIVTDATGRTLKSRMKTSASRITLSFDTKGATYPIIVDPTFSQKDKLVPTDHKAWIRTGFSVAIHGNTALVSAPFNQGTADQDGAVYVFVRSGETWSQEAKLVPHDLRNYDYFGLSVALHGDTALISSYNVSHPDLTRSGAAYVFTRTGSIWTEHQKLEASDAATNDLFGYALAIDGDTALISAYAHNNHRGAAYIFTRSNGHWSEHQKLAPLDLANENYFGQAVALKGTTALISAPGHAHSGLTDSGAVYAYVRSGANWIQQDKLTLNDANTYEYTGNALAVDGNTALIGASGKRDGSPSGRGAAYIFTRQGGSWTQQQKLVASDRAGNNHFGKSVALYNGIALIGAHWRSANSLNRSGSVYVFSRDAGHWSQRDVFTADDTAADDSFGQALAMDGVTAVVGAPWRTEAGRSEGGAAYIFHIDPAPAPTPVPTLTEWAMIALSAALAGLAALTLHRRRRYA